jgi:hypothetical protein
MKEHTFSENNEDLSLEKARELLDDKNISDEELEKLIKCIKIFCKVAYQLYADKDNNKTEHTEGDGAIALRYKKRNKTYHPKEGLSEKRKYGKTRTILVENNRKGEKGKRKYKIIKIVE